jgi:hypothetical protein
VIHFLGQRSGEAIEDEGAEDDDISEEDEIAEDFAGLLDDYYFVELLVLFTTKMHSSLTVMHASGGSVVDV